MRMRGKSVIKGIMCLVKIVGVITLGFYILHVFTAHSQKKSVKSEGKE
jgi:hypothetical protein